MGGRGATNFKKCNYKKPSLARVQKPTLAVFLYFVTLTFDLLIPK